MKKENDILICSFMGYERELEQRNLDRGNTKFWYHIPDPLNNKVFVGFWDIELPFNKSWDFLIPVIKKCRKKQTSLYIKYVIDIPFCDDIYESLLALNINQLYRLVVKFIKIYNKYNE